MNDYTELLREYKSFRNRKGMTYTVIGIICIALYLIDEYTDFTKRLSLFGPSMIFFFVLFSHRYWSDKRPDILEKIRQKLTENEDTAKEIQTRALALIDKSRPRDAMLADGNKVP